MVLIPLVIPGCASTDISESPELSQLPQSSDTVETSPYPEKPSPTPENSSVSVQPELSKTIDPDGNMSPVPEEEERDSEDTDCARMPVFTVSPLDFDDIAEIITLGNLNPPSHTFPTDHMYFYITRGENAESPDVVPFYSPADLTVTRISASQHVNAGFVDYNITLKPCNDITVVFGHVSSLDKTLFGNTSDFSGWHLNNEYDTGGETYRLWMKEYDIEVEAGDVLGTAGGNPGQWALDLGVYDTRYHPELVAAPERWEQSRYLNALCPLGLYESGPVLNRLVSLVKRERIAGEELPYGSVMQDIPGKAKGCWFLAGIEQTYPEDPHLALVRSNIRPTYAVFSVGTSVPGLPSQAYEFLPVDSGVFNRDFKDIIPDDKIYGFQVAGYDGIIILSMPDADTIFIEVLDGAILDPAAWSFTDNKVTFKR
jgi:hypothetical protein